MNPVSYTHLIKQAVPNETVWLDELKIEFLAPLQFYDTMNNNSVVVKLTMVLHSFVSVKRKMSLQGSRNRNFFEDKDLKKKFRLSKHAAKCNVHFADRILQTPSEKMYKVRHESL